jgi:hypothetical protein
MRRGFEFATEDRGNWLRKECGDFRPRACWRRRWIRSCDRRRLQRIHQEESEQVFLLSRRESLGEILRHQ